MARDASLSAERNESPTFLRRKGHVRHQLQFILAGVEYFDFDFFEQFARITSSFWQIHDLVAQLQNM